MLKILIKFGKRAMCYYGPNKWTFAYEVKDINSVDELSDKLDHSTFLVNSKGDDVNDMHLSDEDISIAEDYLTANRENILTFLSDLKKKNFIDSYKFIYDIKK